MDIFSAWASSDLGQDEKIKMLFDKLEALSNYLGVEFVETEVDIVDENNKPVTNFWGMQKPEIEIICKKVKK